MAEWGNHSMASWCLLCVESSASVSAQGRTQDGLIHGRAKTHWTTDTTFMCIPIALLGQNTGYARA
jgi:hypothetical protein